MPSKLATIILAAGQGTRMKSDKPKVVHEIGGEPLVSYPIRLALELGSDPIVVVVGHGADHVKARIDPAFPGKLRYAVQEQQKGTGHAVMIGMGALEGFEGKVVVLYGDVPLLRTETVRQLVNEVEEKKVALSAVMVILPDPTGYGRLIRDPETRKPLRVVEQKDATPAEREIREANAGIYCFDSTFLRGALGKLKNTNAQGEYYLTDMIQLASESPQGVSTTTVADPGEVLGANNRAELADLDRFLRRRVNKEHMLAGVSIVDPETTYIGTRVKIGRDTVIHPGVHLRGSTTIGERVVVEPGAMVTDGTIESDVTINAYSIIEKATVRGKAIIGPFARLRPEAEVLEEAHVGNFVELKKAQLGKGAKANHLAYLGDAVIGAGSNIGAGTITCNYDGYGKYVTRIGERVFVGSNSTLVAPVELGDDAYIAAGSTITDNVAGGSLAFGRARQTEKQGRAVELRKEAKARAEAAKKKKK